jgi:hypothetical protein
MRFAKSIFVIFGLMLFWLCTLAQSDIDFSKLEESIKNRDEGGVILNYENICQQVPDSSLSSLDFDRFLNISHQLSRLGYADYYNNQYEKSDSVFRQNLELGDRYKEISKLNIAFSLNFLGLI